MRIIEGATVTGFQQESATQAIRAVQIEQAGNPQNIPCEQVIIAAGPWVKTFWDHLSLPDTITVKNGATTRDDIPMWRYWALQEGTLAIPPRHPHRQRRPSAPGHPSRQRRTAHH